MDEIIREEAISEVQHYARCINRDKYLEQVVNKIYNNHEALLKAKDDEIKRLNNLYADTIKELGEAVMEIDRLNEAYAEADYECKALNAKLAKKDEKIEQLKKQYHQCLDDYIKCAERKEQQ